MPKYLLLAEKINKNIKSGRVKLEVRHKPPN